MYHNDKLILLILDGWGHGKNPETSAIAQAKTPFIDSLYQNYPNAELTTHGEAVGLPKGQMGNSEVGHLNIGAGRIVYQELLRINNAIKNKQLVENEVLLNALQYAKIHNKPIHLMGLLSDGGVHSHLNHLMALCEIMDAHKIKNTFIHAFTDGRDTDPKSSLIYVKKLQDFLQKSKSKIKLASLIGRYYAMDRDKRWERIKLAYDLLVYGDGQKTDDILQTVQQSHEEGITDEFIKPIVLVDDKEEALATIQAGDVVLCFNFRTDRCRQITEVLTQQDKVEYKMQKIDLQYLTMTNYDDDFENIGVLFEKHKLKNTLGEVLAQQGKKQIRIAETEKYPHVTFFFSGGREEPFKHEKRILMPSPKVATYDLKPEMSAKEITAAVLPELQKQEADFICLNFANTDMVGHTGVFEAAIKAAETVDSCTKQIVEMALKNNYSLLLIADHGNADMMINKDGSPNTAHTTNLVPIFLVAKDVAVKLKNGKLGDVAPTILSIMQLPIPDEMTGEVLFSDW